MITINNIELKKEITKELKKNETITIVIYHFDDIPFLEVNTFRDNDYIVFFSEESNNIEYLKTKQKELLKYLSKHFDNINFIENIVYC